MANKKVSDILSDNEITAMVNGDYLFGNQASGPTTGCIKRENVLSLEYGSIIIASGVTTQTTNATADTYDIITGWNTAQGSNGASTTGVTPAKTSNKITLVDTGFYLVCFTVSFTGSNNTVYTIAAFLNAVEQTGLCLQRKIGTGTDVGNSSFQGIIDNTTGSWDLDVRVKADGSSADYIPAFSTLAVTRIGPT